MPNPLSRALPRNLSKNPPKDRAIEPVPEQYEGINFPYRGIEQHGVEATVDPSPVPGYGSGRDVVYDEEAPEIEPIPVVVYQTGGSKLRRSRTFRSFAPIANPVQLVGRDESRIKVKVKNVGTADIIVGDSATTANAQHGWPLAQNQEYESETQDTLYALSTHATDGMPVAITVVYEVEV